MKIYTKTGDKGKTSLIGGSRVNKHDIRLEAYGSVDELITWVGLLRDYIEDLKLKNTLILIQDKLMVCSSILATDNDEFLESLPKLNEKDVLLIENEIDEINILLPPLNSFVLPGGHKVVSYCHITRTVCRRAERVISLLSAHTKIDMLIIKYINRLSDYFFTLSRKLSMDFNAEEITWKP